MTSLAWVLAAIAAVLGVADWTAVWLERRTVRFVTKPASLAFLIAAVVVAEPYDEGVATWMTVGLVLSLLGDICLLGESKRWFIGGLVSFLLGHVAYVVAMGSQFESWTALLVGAALVTLSVATVGRQVVARVGAGPTSGMAVPVSAYLVVISAMVLSAFGTAAPWAMLGAVLFYVSDATLAWNRFIERRRFGPVAVMVTYHLAQASLVAWVVNG